LLIIEGDVQRWIVVRPVAGGRSVKLDPFSPNQFIFEHSGSGEYEVQTMDTNREPVFSYFTVGDDEDDGPDMPDDPAGDFAELIKIAEANANNDLETRKKIGQAWQAVLVDRSGTLEELKRKFGKARGDVLSLVRDQDGSWNKWLLSVDGWFVSNAKAKETYLEAMTTLTKWMLK